MNDEFLTHFREQPEAEFADTLYEHISKQKPSILSRLYTKPTIQEIVIVFLALLLIAAGVRYITTTHRWQKVGSVWVEVQNKYTVDIPPKGSVNPTLRHPSIGSMTPSEAEKVLGFDVAIPSWMPNGFTWDGKVELFDWSKGDIVWKNDGGGMIELDFKSLKYWNPAIQGYSVKEPSTPPVAPGSFKEVQINGQSAVLVLGDWVLPSGAQTGKVDLKWDKRASIMLIWGFKDIQYRLWTSYSSVTAEELIHMVGSAR
jgi:hypothetical protein